MIGDVKAFDDVEMERVNMKPILINSVALGADESCVLQYLENFPDDFVTEMEIARRADGRTHFMDDTHWAHIALSQLIESGLLETDGLGKFRLKDRSAKAHAMVRKFLAPEVREILEHSSHHFDLSGYA